MTVLRREDVQSCVASWDIRPDRIVRPPILTIVPRIIRRLRGPSPNRIMLPVVDRPSVARGSSPRRRCGGLQRRPQKARELARDRHGDLRGWLRSLQLLADTSGPPAWRLPGDETTLDCWLGIIVTRSARGSWTFPELHAWITRVDRDRIVCGPAALEVT